MDINSSSRKMGSPTRPVCHRLVQLHPQTFNSCASSNSNFSSVHLVHGDNSNNKDT